ncbi:MAG: hypothetical protein ACRDLR_06555 [Gaiellaceae bacterium]
MSSASLRVASVYTLANGAEERGLEISFGEARIYLTVEEAEKFHRAIGDALAGFDHATAREAA